VICDEIWNCRQRKGSVSFTGITVKEREASPLQKGSVPFTFKKMEKQTGLDLHYKPQGRPKKNVVK
jgi:hypothetical protein